MTKEEKLKYDLKKSRRDNEIYKTENAILRRLNSNSEFPLCMNKLIDNLKKQNRILQEENNLLLKRLYKKPTN